MVMFSIMVFGILTGLAAGGIRDLPRDSQRLGTLARSLSRI